MVNTPIPHSLKSEANKAAKILSEFSMPSAKAGPDKIIPVGILVNAKGLAILTVFKIGFLVTVRGGSGIVIAKLEDGSWSAPSAIGIAGLGGGFEIGGEVTDFVIILNKQSAVEAFSKGGNLTLGGNFTVAAGPIGRNVEADVAVRGQAAIYTYSKTKGLFAGISIEGSYLIERKDANKKFYGEEIRAYDILGGGVDRPENCHPLYEVLEKHKTMYHRMLEAQAKKAARKGAEMAAEKYSPGLVGRVKSMKGGKSKKSRSGSGGQDYGDSDDGDYSASGEKYDEWSTGGGMTRSKSVYTHSTTTTTTKTTRRGSGGFTSSSKIKSASTDQIASAGHSASHGWSNEPIISQARVPTKCCQALWPYQAQMPCDLTFDSGEVIEILTQTDHHNDWWEGRCHGKIGIFPANYTKMVS